MAQSTLSKIHYCTWHDERNISKGRELENRRIVELQQTHQKQCRWLAARYSSWVMLTTLDYGTEPLTGKTELSTEFWGTVDTDALTTGPNFINRGWAPCGGQQPKYIPMHKPTLDRRDAWKTIPAITLGEPLAICPTTVVQPVTTNELCQDYAHMVKTVDVVSQVFVAETEGSTTVFTIINAPPFEDALRTPIYDAQLQILIKLTNDMLIDFRVHNVRELSADVKLKHIIPSNASLIWQR